MVASGALTLLFGSRETSDFWVDGLRVWWGRVSAGHRSIRRLVIYLDNGPKCSGRRTQFLKRMVEFADWSGLEIRLVYYPPRTTASTTRSSGAGRVWSGSGAGHC